MPEKSLPWIPFNFLALPEEQSRLDQARVVVLPVPYDGTVSFKSGARDGPRAIIEASYNLEDYDPELDKDVAQVGIHTTPWLEPNMQGPLHMVERIQDAVYPFLMQGKLVAMIGGEHSISLGLVRALMDFYPDLSVLFLDAHADLRDEYMGTGWGHASVARRIYEICPIVQAGVRCLSAEEREFIRNSGINTFTWPHLGRLGGSSRSDTPSHRTASSTQEGQSNVAEILGLLSRHVYVTIDLDVLDLGIMSAVGTPEPGGMDWYEIISLLRAVAEQRRIVGFDVAELTPGEGPASCAYTAAKLVYKLLAYATLLAPGREGSSSMGASSAVEPFRTNPIP